MAEKTLGQVAYEGLCRGGGIHAVDWSSVGDRAKRQYEGAAEAVATALRTREGERAYTVRLFNDGAARIELQIVQGFGEDGPTVARVHIPLRPHDHDGPHDIDASKLNSPHDALKYQKEGT